jgi:hypothetical protein
MLKDGLHPLIALLSLLACVALLNACTPSRAPDEVSPTAADTTATVEVDNRGFPDMTVYLLDGGRRVRLGEANGNAVTKLTIPSYLLRGGLPLRFLCDPIGSSREPVSDEIMVNPGDDVVLVVPAS